MPMFVNSRNETRQGWVASHELGTSVVVPESLIADRTRTWNFSCTRIGVVKFVSSVALKAVALVVLELVFAVVLKAVALVVLELVFAVVLETSVVLKST